jgi:NAD(P)-dependent dehydrogenase (short-subunit alcohol dehydrogenase family)
MMENHDPVVVVTGASRGIGRAVAEDLARHGYWVWLVARDADALHRAVTEIRQDGGRADMIPYDITRIDDAPQVMCELVEKAGKLDGLINNAGTTRRGSLRTITPTDFDAVMTVNVKSLLFLTQAAVAVMNPGGAIVNLASLNAFDVLKGAGLYATTKAAVVQLTRALAIDVADLQIRVNAVAPGFIHTEFNTALWDRPDMREWVETNTPFQRLGTPRDVVGAIRFLLGPDSAFMTGSVLVVDGGFLPSRLWPL